MKISENGAPILSGRGLQEVRKLIEVRFAEARKGLVTPDRNSQKFSPTLKSGGQGVEHRPLQPLAEIVAPVLRAAERSFDNAPLHHHRHEIYVVSKPKESAAQLFTECEEAMLRLNMAEGKSHRYDMEES